MQNSNTKANKFQEFLEASQINCFGVREMNDAVHTVLFRTNLEVGGQQLPVLLVTDDGIYTLLQVQIAPEVIREGNGQSVLDHINTLNRSYKSFKFFINDENALILDVCLTAMPEQFDPQLVSLTLDTILRHLADEYPLIMRKIWGDAAAAQLS